MVKFPCLVCEKAVGTNHNAVCCDMCDTWVHIYCNNICKERHRDLKKDQTPWSCKSCIRKEIPFSSLNDTELTHLSKRMSVLPKRKDKLPTTNFEKLNIFTLNEDIKYKYYTKDQFKELGFDKNSKQMSLMHLNISSLHYHIDGLTNLLNELNTNFKVIGITESILTTKKMK